MGHPREAPACGEIGSQLFLDLCLRGMSILRRPKAAAARARGLGFG